MFEVRSVILCQRLRREAGILCTTDGRPAVNIFHWESHQNKVRCRDSGECKWNRNLKVGFIETWFLLFEFLAYSAAPDRSAAVFLCHGWQKALEVPFAVSAMLHRQTSALTALWFVCVRILEPLKPSVRRVPGSSPGGRTSGVRGCQPSTTQCRG